jgi:hypothetical protein
MALRVRRDCFQRPTTSAVQAEGRRLRFREDLRRSVRGTDADFAVLTPGEG